MCTCVKCTCVCVCVRRLLMCPSKFREFFEITETNTNTLAQEIFDGKRSRIFFFDCWYNSEYETLQSEDNTRFNWRWYNHVYVWMMTLKSSQLYAMQITKELRIQVKLKSKPEETFDFFHRWITMMTVNWRKALHHGCIIFHFLSLRWSLFWFHRICNDVRSANSHVQNKQAKKWRKKPNNGLKQNIKKKKKRQKRYSLKLKRIYNCSGKQNNQRNR